jgi:hypothetical protein
MYIYLAYLKGDVPYFFIVFFQTVKVSFLARDRDLSYRTVPLRDRYRDRDLMLISFCFY